MCENGGIYEAVKVVRAEIEAENVEIKEASIMDRMTLAVIFGGYSSEYDVSLQSASAVIKAINKSKYNVVMLGIDRLGEWYRFTGDVDRIAADTWRDDSCCRKAFIAPSRDIHGIIELDGKSGCFVRVDLAFPVLHGRNGEDGTLQGLLELAGIPVVGCGALPSALCMDKELAHIVVSNTGIKTPRGVTLRSAAEIKTAVERADGLHYPVFVKPARAGSSFGVTCVKRPEDLQNAVQAALAHDNKVIVEEMIEGFEVGCAVMGNEEGLITGSVDEIELVGDLFDFTEKYTLKTSKIHVPARIPAQKAEEIKDTAKTIYKALGCTGFARIDMFLTPSSEIIFNEVNTIPGFTTHSRYPNMLGVNGMAFEQIIDTVIGLAVRV